MEITFSDQELERLLTLFPDDCGNLNTPQLRRNLMVNNYPAVARKMLEEEGLLDQQLTG